MLGTAVIHVTSELIARSGPLLNIVDRYGISLYFWAHSEEWAQTATKRTAAKRIVTSIAARM